MEIEKKKGWTIDVAMLGDSRTEDRIGGHKVSRSES